MRAPDTARSGYDTPPGRVNMRRIRIQHQSLMQCIAARTYMTPVQSNHTRTHNARSEPTVNVSVTGCDSMSLPTHAKENKPYAH